MLTGGTAPLSFCVEPPTAVVAARGENAKALADVAKRAKSTNFFMTDILLLLLWMSRREMRRARSEDGENLEWPWVRATYEIQDDDAPDGSPPMVDELRKLKVVLI